MTCFHEHIHLHDGEVLVFGVDSIPVIITGMFTYIKCSSYLRDGLSPWSKFMSELLSSFWKISQITKSHVLHEWPMPGILMGHTCVVTAGTNGDLQSVAVWRPTFCPLLMFMLVPHGAPDSEILWAPWMANEWHSHGPHMGCQWWGPWGLATRCHAGPTYLPLLMPIWPSMGPMYVWNHPANIIPWAPWGACVITGDRKGHPKRSAVARPGKYDETESCKVIAFMEHRSHLKQVSCETTICPGNRVRVCDKIIPTYICLYCNQCKNLHWHYMWFTVIDSWNCSCKATDLTHIGLTLGSFWPMKQSMWGHCFVTDWRYIGFMFVSPWNYPCMKRHFAIHSTNETSYVKPASCQPLELHRAHPGQPFYPHICNKWNSHWSAHNIAHVKSLFCDILVKLGPWSAHKLPVLCPRGVYICFLVPSICPPYPWNISWVPLVFVRSWFCMKLPL